jgi:hypothetical protein
MAVTQFGRSEVIHDCRGPIRVSISYLISENDIIYLTETKQRPRIGFNVFSQLITRLGFFDRGNWETPFEKKKKRIAV